MKAHVLLLGGTGEARELAAQLTALELTVTSSLAGRTDAPAPIAGAVRSGGFGGPHGLAAWLTEHAVDAVVDATHPFAEQISTSARAACTEAGVPLLRLRRPGWTARGADRWTRVASLEEAATAIDAHGTRVLLTTGRQGLAAFAGVRAWVLVRCLQVPEPPLPAASQVLLDRGPFTVAGERALLERHAIDLVVSKDSGGPGTEAKLEAARDQGIPVLLVARAGDEDTPAVASVAEAVAWVMMRA